MTQVIGNPLDYASAVAARSRRVSDKKATSKDVLRQICVMIADRGVTLKIGNNMSSRFVNLRDPQRVIKTLQAAYKNGAPYRFLFSMMQYNVHNKDMPVCMTWKQWDYVRKLAEGGPE